MGLLNVASELDSVSEYEGPGLAEVRKLGLDGVLRGVGNPENFLTNGDTMLGHGGQTSNKAEEADVDEGVALFSRLVKDNSGILVDWGVRHPVESSQVIEFSISCCFSPGTKDGAGCLSDLRDHI